MVVLCVAAVLGRHKPARATWPKARKSPPAPAPPPPPPPVEQQHVAACLRNQSLPCPQPCPPAATLGRHCLTTPIPAFGVPYRRIRCCFGCCLRQFIAAHNLTANYDFWAANTAFRASNEKVFGALPEITEVASPGALAAVRGAVPPPPPPATTGTPAGGGGGGGDREEGRRGVGLGRAGEATSRVPEEGPDSAIGLHGHPLGPRTGYHHNTATRALLEYGARRARFSPISPRLSPFAPLFVPVLGTPEKAGVM